MFTSQSVMVRACVVLAPGFEPVEAITPIDFLRRAGVEVVVAAVDSKDLHVKSMLDVTIKCDVRFDQVAGQVFDAIVCPGGLPGATNLGKDPRLIAAIQGHLSSGKVVGAICASPGMFLGDACKVLKGRKACGYPGCDDGIALDGGVKLEDKVVIDGNLVTSRGPGTALYFALALIRVLCGEAAEQKVGKGALAC